jgi:predicted aspartyl protease
MHGLNMKAVCRSLLLFACAMGVSSGLMSATPTKAPELDFDRWLASEAGRKASLEQMRQRCEQILDATNNLNCSVSVVARMFELKAANQLPDYFVAIKDKHARAIEANAELKVLFSMFGNESLSTLRATDDFSVSRTRQREVLTLHPYSSEHFVSDEILPFIDVRSQNGHSARFVVDTGAPQSRVNYATAKLMGIRLLTDSHYAYSTFYGESDLSAKLGVIESLSVGASEFRNVLVFVSDRDNLLGLDLISKLGPLKLTRKTLELNAARPVRCDSPITYTRLDINQRLTIPARLDNRATFAIVDTGNVDYLTSAAPGAQVNVVTSMTPGNSPDNTADQHYQVFKGVLKLPGNTLSLTYKYYPGFTIPPSQLLGRYVPSILLGWRAFDDFELNLDIEAGRSCFNKV